MAGEPEYTLDSTLSCPDCDEEVHIGTGGPKNLEIHQCTSKACKVKCEQKARGQAKLKQKQDHSLLTFFGPQKVLVPSTITAPPLVQIQSIQAVTSTSSSSHPSVVNGKAQHLTSSPTPESNGAKQLLRHLADRIADILDTIPLADEKHLAIFSGAPAGHIVPDLHDWEDILNPMMHWAFGYGATTENTEILKSLP
ncbi:hypothetical protein L208DRAFT_1332334 [Tricholoma matsutake]|nr:hypothetical protein L208DRAFT_1332334 [Tricholoma matsutake 945]